MKWSSKDISQYVQAREYIDTVVLPLIPINFKENIQTLASQGEYITILSYELERQFKGRIILMPSYSYPEDLTEEQKIAHLHALSLHMKESGVKHVFLLTSDSTWIQHEQQLEGKLIWLPAIPMQDMEEKYQQKIIQDQMNQLLPMFIQKWQN
ncbi:hypothetical protein FIU87_12080 [Bacillus sp. THAF10]|uniref:YpiF family protein n=1 Tax=Bacillus sp. THAF10 TaxID=2587848 RepID=UPI0012681416|nr:YpiF family protein [Bacillus sp. THAF10]QFT89387.1 hypothetical protein FIU87_12080 [Bacillus sp. THAF10]